MLYTFNIRYFTITNVREQSLKTKLIMHNIGQDLYANTHTAQQQFCELHPTTFSLLLIFTV